MEYAGSQLSTSVDLGQDYEAMAYHAGANRPARIISHLNLLFAIIILLLVAAAFISLATWSANDPSLSNSNGRIISNWMGFWGASFADIFIQFFGLASAISLFPAAIIGWLKIMRHQVGEIKNRLLCWPVMVILTSAAMATLSTPQTWPLPSGLGGLIGDLVLKIPEIIAGGPPSGWFAIIMFAVFAIPAFVLALYASGLINRRSASYPDGLVDVFDEEEFEDEAGSFLAWGALVHWYLSIKSRFFKARRGKNIIKPDKPATRGLFNPLKAIYNRLLTPADDGLENFISPGDERSAIEENSAPSTPQYGEQIYDAIGQDLAVGFQNGINNNADINNLDNANFDALTPARPQNGSKPKRVQPMAPKPKQSRRVADEAQTNMFGTCEFILPSLHFLSEPKSRAQKSGLSNEELEQNARLLEGVLGDFGVKGEIINVRPGPVVTLYELEPAPGIKSSRVIGLADDIARSMSAISARVAVVPGRNAIGIELPNELREVVYLREVMASEIYDKSKAKLPLILGKNIGGEPVVADLAKMPHLLVAGTTGSGKSVAINTMILSILFRLNPDQVKMIMIDPKMLELSIYDGIPHLLTPVVTDPKKAVVALKWTVREMEERYKSMSKLGVRNIDGYNIRLAQAVAKNEVITKTVQTGFDRETGEAIYESEELDLKPMPYIVVIIDEMADLMMVAGKDIEGTVQRLAQMARAAGIHVVMATQRPSVDVITGTIKANFPTRISFQVTSKIDSRTILGEQGAEQLLGMGDMLYQAGGGRTARVHGPFVDDDEVEKIVSHLKTQGAPQYLESVTTDDDEDAAIENASGGGNISDSGDIYDQAVSIVLHDRKVSTSYIQRRLSIGYNRAATLIERMEQEGVISAANHSGKREILVPAEDETI